MKKLRHIIILGTVLASLLIVALANAEAPCNAISHETLSGAVGCAVAVRSANDNLHPFHSHAMRIAADPYAIPPQLPPAHVIPPYYIYFNGTFGYRTTGFTNPHLMWPSSYYLYRGSYY